MAVAGGCVRHVTPAGQGAPQGLRALVLPPPACDDGAGVAWGLWAMNEWYGVESGREAYELRRLASPGGVAAQADEVYAADPKWDHLLKAAQRRYGGDADLVRDLVAKITYGKRMSDRWKDFFADVRLYDGAMDAAEHFPAGAPQADVAKRIALFERSLAGAAAEALLRDEDWTAVREAKLPARYADKASSWFGGPAKKLAAFYGAFGRALPEIDRCKQAVATALTALEPRDTEWRRNVDAMRGLIVAGRLAFNAYVRIGDAARETLDLP